MVTKAEALAELAARGKLPKAVPKPNAQEAPYLNSLKTDASRALNTATQAERFLELNKKTPTGGLAGWPGVGEFVRNAKGALNPDWAAMEGIGASVAPNMRPPGSGSSSDKDTEMYIRGFTNTRVPYEANKQTYDRLHAQSDQAAAHSAFMDSWFQHRGTLLGGEQAFSSYWAKKHGGAGPEGLNAAHLSDDDIKKALGL